MQRVSMISIDHDTEGAVGGTTLEVFQFLTLQ